jgi:hypothetical protein
LAAALLRAMRGTDASASQGREWASRAMSADPQIGALLGIARGSYGDDDW